MLSTRIYALAIICTFLQVLCMFWNIPGHAFIAGALVLLGIGEIAKKLEK
jgi:hypothetical protein